MIVIPSVEISHRSGEFEDLRTRISEWEWVGFRRVQLGLSRRGSDPAVVRWLDELIRDHYLDVQVAGATKSLTDVEELCAAGATSVVLGPRALEESEWLATAAAAFPSILVVDLPVRDRQVRTRGTVRTRSVDVLDAADELGDHRLAGLLVTFADEAVLSHEELTLIEDLVERLPFPVMVRGGVQSLGMLRDLEFRGAASTIIGAAALSDIADEQTLARSFSA